MTSKVVLSSAAVEPFIGPPAREPTPEPARTQAPRPKEPAPSSSGQPDLRLEIQETDGPGHYVYTVVDRTTGEIISQLPREEVLRMKERQDYAAGTVFNGKA